MVGGLWLVVCGLKDRDCPVQTLVDKSKASNHQPQTRNYNCFNLIFLNLTPPPWS